MHRLMTGTAVAGARVVGNFFWRGGFARPIKPERLRPQYFASSACFTSGGS